MLFNSVQFIFLFLPCVLLLFFVAGYYSRQVAITILLAASIAFYGYWKPEFIPLLMGSIFCNYAAALLILRWQGLRRGKIVLIGAIAANLIVLGVFKYYNFFVSTLDAVFPGIPQANIILPIGISFFTFTQIAFLVDAWRKIATERNFIRYALFVTYFPHLIAGPVLHHKQMMPQFADKATYRFSVEAFSTGVVFFVIGLFKKVVIADPFSPYAAGLFDHVSSGEAPPILAAWIGAAAYTFQIYFDFSGYSDMAVGISKMFGITLPFNFNSPYKSTSVIEFWRRWHMSLSQFLRDYLYFTLGGNRHGEVRRYINLMLTMLLGGLWHGANWTYVAWGGLHGLYLAINHGWRRLIPSNGPPSITSRTLGWGATFLAVMVAWVFFRARGWSEAVTILSAMTGASGVVLPTSWAAALGSVGHGLSVHGVQFSDAAFQVAGHEIPSPKRFMRMAALALAIIALPNSQQIAAFMLRAARGTEPRLEMILGRLRKRRGLVAAGFGLGGVTLGLAFFVCLTLLRRKAEFLYFQF